MMIGITSQRSAGADVQRLQEEALVAALRSGDARAVDELVQLYGPRLLRFIRQAIAADGADADDLLQETLLAAVRGLRAYRGESGFYTWLCAIARHKAADFIRRQQRRRRTSVDASLDDLVELPSSAPDLGGTVAQEQALRQALAGLPEDYRMVLVGKYLEGFSVQEIAAVLGRSEKSVESLLTRARAALRERLRP